MPHVIPEQIQKTLIGLYHEIGRIVHIFRSFEFVAADGYQTADHMVVPLSVDLHQRFVGLNIPMQNPGGVTGGHNQCDEKSPPPA